MLSFAAKKGFCSVLAALLNFASSQTGQQPEACPAVALVAWLNNLLKSSAALGHEGCVRVLLAKVRSR